MTNDQTDCATAVVDGDREFLHCNSFKSLTHNYIHIKFKWNYIFFTMLKRHLCKERRWNKNGKIKWYDFKFYRRLSCVVKYVCTAFESCTIKTICVIVSDRNTLEGQTLDRTYYSVSYIFCRSITSNWYKVKVSGFLNIELIHSTFASNCKFCSTYNCMKYLLVL